MTLPAAADQVQFLTNFQKLLTEGQYTATYKFALLLALTDIAVETTSEPESGLLVDTETLAVKFVQYYWRQTLPYASKEEPDGKVLSQNTNPNKEASILSVLGKLRLMSGASISEASRNSRHWKAAVKKIARTIEVMPLWKLQTIAGQQFNFLYENRWHMNRRGLILLNPGVAFHLRRFHPLIQSLIKDAWARHIRKLDINKRSFGQLTDLHEFLFGSEREDLSRLVPILVPIQNDSCFYCGLRLREQRDVDHFIPWSKYSLDLAHNFVITHPTCNSAKSNYLPALPHLSKWMHRNKRFKSDLEQAFQTSGLIFSLQLSIRVAHWAYEQAEFSGTRLWLAKRKFCDIDPKWRDLVIQNAQEVFG